MLSTARKETVLSITTPQNPREVREFLGFTGFCRLWNPGFAEITKPLYETTRETENFTWTQDYQKAFDNIKQALLSTPALGLLNIMKPFHLYVY